MLSLEYQFLTICLKSYILRKTCEFAQIAQKNLRKTKISFHSQLSQKIFPVLRKLRKNFFLLIEGFQLSIKYHRSLAITWSLTSTCYQLLMTNGLGSV